MTVTNLWFRQVFGFLGFGIDRSLFNKEKAYMCPSSFGHFGLDEQYTTCCLPDNPMPYHLTQSRIQWDLHIQHTHQKCQNISKTQRCHCKINLKNKQFFIFCMYDCMCAGLSHFNVNINGQITNKKYDHSEKSTSKHRLQSKLFHSSTLTTLKISNLV